MIASKCFVSGFFHHAIARRCLREKGAVSFTVVHLPLQGGEQRFRGLFGFGIGSAFEQLFHRPLPVGELHLKAVAVVLD